MGGLLGASMVWMSTTKKGKEVRDKLLDSSADVYLDLKEKVLASDAYDKLTKQEFVVMAKEAVDKYAVSNGLAEKAKNTVVKLVGAQWNQLQKELNKGCGGKCKGNCKCKGDKDDCCK